MCGTKKCRIQWRRGFSSFKPSHRSRKERPLSPCDAMKWWSLSSPTRIVPTLWLARPFDSPQSCNALHDGVLLHQREKRYPRHQCKSHTLCHKQVVKFRYRITEEKHTNTTVKSSHYGKIEGIEYWGTSHWLFESWLVSFATLRSASVTWWVTSLLFYRQIKERTISQQNTLQNLISTVHKYN